MSELSRSLAPMDVRSGASSGIGAERVLYRARILVVDDDASASALIRHVLERHGFRNVDATDDGTKALDAVFDRPPDVVVLDAHMPGIDGLEVVRQIRTVEPACVTSMAPGIVAVSGDESTSTRRAMLAAGADDFVVRPCDWTEFAFRIRHLADKILRYRAMRGYADELEDRIRDLASAVQRLGTGGVSPAATDLDGPGAY